MKLISKSRFLQYLICPKDTWFRLHMPDLKEFEISFSEKNIMDQGNIVEDYAKKLKIFSGFVEIKNRTFSASKEIDELMSQKVRAIYQPTFIADGFIIRCDFIVWNSETKKWDLYEVKGTNSKKDDDGPRDHISDVAFQTIVLERYGVNVGRKYIVHLDKEYIRGEQLDVEKLFVKSDSTEQVDSKKEITVEQMEKAKKYLNQEKEPKDGCDCLFYGRNSHCVTIKRSHPEIKDHSIYDLSNIRTGKLTQLINDGIHYLHEIEDASDFSVPQQNQIHACKTGKEIIDVKEIANILDGYTYPLYFFDYETFAPAVPIYPGYGTWQRIPIQFSLHIIDKKNGPVHHIGYLHKENSDPSLVVSKMLSEIIDPKGTILAWNVSVERGITEDIAVRGSEYDKVLNRISSQMKDLRDVFSKQHYVHKDFEGKSGIESVMKVLVPKMTYDNLPYTGVDVGFVWWQDIVNEGQEPSERSKKIYLLEEYCKQDTLVMVEIFRILNDIIKK